MHLNLVPARLTDLWYVVFILRAKISFVSIIFYTLYSGTARVVEVEGLAAEEVEGVMVEDPWEGRGLEVSLGTDSNHIECHFVLFKFFFIYGIKQKQSVLPVYEYSSVEEVLNIRKYQYSQCCQ